MYAALGRVFLGLVGMVAQTGVAQDQALERRGEELLRAKCARCHSVLRTYETPDSTHLILEGEQFWTDAVGG